MTRYKLELLEYGGRDPKNNMVLGSWRCYDSTGGDNPAEQEFASENPIATWDVSVDEADEIRRGAVPDHYVPAEELPV